MTLINKFPYKEMKRETTTEGRKYLAPDGEKLPSVTTILDATKPIGLRLQKAGAHAAHQFVRPGPPRPNRRGVGRPARLWLRRCAKTRQDPLAKGDGQLPDEPRQPVWCGLVVRPAPWHDRARRHPARGHPPPGGGGHAVFGLADQG